MGNNPNKGESATPGTKLAEDVTTPHAYRVNVWLDDVDEDVMIGYPVGRIARFEGGRLSKEKEFRFVGSSFADPEGDGLTIGEAYVIQEVMKHVCELWRYRMGSLSRLRFLAMFVLHHDTGGYEIITRS